MAKIKYDVTDVEEFMPYAGPTPKRGVYEGIVRAAEFGPSKAGNDQFTFTVVLDSKKKEQKQFNGCPLFQYLTIGDLSEDWQKRNLKMAIKAFGLKEKGTLDPAALAEKLDKSNPRVRIIVRNEMFEESLTAKANGLLALKGEDEAEDAEDSEDEDAEDTETEETEESEEDEDEDEEEDDLSELDRAGLKAYIKENELDIKVTKSKSDDDIRAEIMALSDAGEEDDDEETSVEDDVKDLDRAALKAYIKENELNVSVKKSMSDDDVRAAIVEAWPDEDDEADDSEAPF